MRASAPAAFAATWAVAVLGRPRPSSPVLGAILDLHHGGEVEADAVHLYFGERSIGRCTGCFKAHEAYDVEVEDLVRAEVLAPWPRRGRLW